MLLKCAYQYVEERTNFMDKLIKKKIFIETKNVPVRPRDEYPPSRIHQPFFDVLHTSFRIDAIYFARDLFYSKNF